MAEYFFDDSWIGDNLIIFLQILSNELWYHNSNGHVNGCQLEKILKRQKYIPKNPMIFFLNTWRHEISSAFSISVCLLAKGFGTCTLLANILFCTWWAFYPRLLVINIFFFKVKPFLNSILWFCNKLWMIVQKNMI